MEALFLGHLGQVTEGAALLAQAGPDAADARLPRYFSQKHILSRHFTNPGWNRLLHQVPEPGQSHQCIRVWDVSLPKLPRLPQTRGERAAPTSSHSVLVGTLKLTNTQEGGPQHVRQ